MPVANNCLLLVKKMKRISSIQFKAAFLLLVFALNTAIGFACSVGIELGLNLTHHHDEETTRVSLHVHADGKKHQHHDKAVKHHNDSKTDSEKSGCCNDNVIKFQNLDKSLTQNTIVVITVPVFAAILSSFFGVDIFKQVQVSEQKYIFDCFHPPPQDIRILIQRFQI